MALVLRHAGRRLVEQQHARLAGDRDRDLEQPLLAVRQDRGALVHHVGEMESLEQREHFVDDLGFASDNAPPVMAGADTFRYREPERLERRQIREKLIDLEGARDAEPHARMRAHVGDVAALEQDLPSGRREHAGQQIDDGGLAGAVRSDQRVARALLDLERHITGRDDAAETLLEIFRGEDDRHGQAPSLRRQSSLSAYLRNGSVQLVMRSRPIITITTSSKPIQNGQYCGVSTAR